jgi:1-phosphatidylinositol phosphodiesterase
MKHLFLAIGVVATVVTCSAAASDRAYDQSPRHLSPATESWMKNLPDDLPLTSISIPGTHDSTALTRSVTRSSTQGVGIAEQLRLGIRAIDIVLADSTFIDPMFPVGPVLVSGTRAYLEPHVGVVADFLKAHPSETVLVKVDGSIDRNELATLLLDVWSHPTIGPYFWKPGGANPAVPTLGAVRGKMVLLQGSATAHLPLGFVEQPGSARFDVQNDNHVSTNWALYDKWVKVKTQLGKANRQWPADTFFINSLHGSGGAPPWFVASGNLTSATGSPNLSTGYLSRYGTNGWEDFPRAGCVFGDSLCSIMFEGTNPLTLGYIRTARPMHVGVVRADYPGRGLIGAVIDLNKGFMPPVQLSWDWSGRCLDVKGGSQTGSTEVVANKCDAASPSQRWLLSGSGTIRSQYEPRMCVVANAGQSLGSRLRFGACTPENQPYFVDRGQGLFAIDAAPDLCMEASFVGSTQPDTPIRLGTCNVAMASQRFNPSRLPTPLVTGHDVCLHIEQDGTVTSRTCVYGLDVQEWTLKEDATVRPVLGPNGCLTFYPGTSQPLRYDACLAASAGQRWDGKPDGTLRPRNGRDACLTVTETLGASVAPCAPGDATQRIAFGRTPVQLRWHNDLCMTRSDNPADATVVSMSCDASSTLWRLMLDQTVRLAQTREQAESGTAPQRCLSLAGNAVSAGVTLVEDVCVKGQTAQRWLSMPDRSLRPQSQQGLCVESPDASTARHHRLKLAACRPDYAAQRWTAS